VRVQTISVVSSNVLCQTRLASFIQPCDDCGFVGAALQLDIILARGSQVSARGDEVMEAVGGRVCV
jgi:hypothetical protein